MRYISCGQLVDSRSLYKRAAETGLRPVVIFRKAVCVLSVNCLCFRERLIEKQGEMCARLSILAITLALVAVHRADAAMTMEAIQKTAAGVRNTCTSKTNADPALVAGMQKGEFPDDEKLKCYTLCVMKTMRTFKNGRIDDAMMIKQVDLMMPEEYATHLRATTVKCAAEPPAGDDCSTCLQFVKCSYETDKEFFFFP